MDYMACRDDVDFLRFKPAYEHYPWWKAAFYIHVFSAIFALLAAFTQFSKFTRKNRPFPQVGRTHLYAFDILVVNFPAGMVLALCANGLLPGRGAFILLDILWFAFTFIGVWAARQGLMARHRDFMIRCCTDLFSHYAPDVEIHPFPYYPHRSLTLVYDRCLDGVHPKPARLAELIVRSGRWKEGRNTSIAKISK